MNSIRNSVNEALSATNVLLVFVVMLFSLRYPIIIKDINREKPRTELVREREREKRRLIQSLTINCMPQIILIGITAYIFLPMTLYILKNSKFNLWNFDFVITIFIFVVFWIWIFFIWSILLGLRVFIKAIKLKSKN